MGNLETGKDNNMHVKVKLFATLRQNAGWGEKSIELADGSTLGDLYSQIATEIPNIDLADATVYAAINQEYAQSDRALAEGDVVAMFPPVSGGESAASTSSGTQSKLFEIVAEPLSLDDVAARVSRPDCGGITTFAGVVRGETTTDNGERSTDFLGYEAYTEMAEQMMAQIGDEIIKKWPKVKRVSILHRTGRCEVGEASVVIAVATPHRGDGCFEACQYAIERLKAIVPIWKQENWADGQVWVEGPRQPELVIAPPSKSSNS